MGTTHSSEMPPELLRMRLLSDVLVLGPAPTTVIHSVMLFSHHNSVSCLPWDERPSARWQGPTQTKPPTRVGGAG